MRGIEIPFEYVNLVDLDFFNLHSKGVFIDGDKKAVIVIEPDEVFMKSLKRLNVKYKELPEEETYRYVKDILIG